MKNNLTFEMPKKKFTIEFIVGIFVIFGILCFAYLSINLASIKIFKNNFYTVTAKFDNISGLLVGAPVEIAGVRVGEVSKISLDNTSALLSLSINNGIELRDDDIASIRTKGIIGEKYVKILPGGADDVIKADGRLSETESAVDLEEIIGKVIHRME